MFKKMVSKKAEGVLTGILWMAVVAIVSGAIGAAMWGNAGISGAGKTSKDTILTQMTNRTGTGTTSGSEGAGSIHP